MRRLWVTCAAVAILFAGAACQGDSADDLATEAPASPAPALPEADETVSIDDFQYEPDRIRVELGTSIAWENADSREHTVTAENEAFDSGDIAADGNFVQLFEQVGVYDYYCTIHGEDRMSGRVTVEAPDEE